MISHPKIIFMILIKGRYHWIPDPKGRYAFTELEALPITLYLAGPWYSLILCVLEKNPRKDNYLLCDTYMHFLRVSFYTRDTKNWRKNSRGIIRLQNGVLIRLLSGDFDEIALTCHEFPTLKCCVTSFYVIYLEITLGLALFQKALQWLLAKGSELSFEWRPDGA